MAARIFKQGKSAMQSGMAKSGVWILEFNSEGTKTIEPLMGWTGSAETQTQVKLQFKTMDDAIAYADKEGIDYSVSINKSRKPVIRKNGYGENFSTNRKGVWTHYKFSSCQH